MAVYCFTQPIQPGKRDEARAIFEEIRTSRQDEYEASRKRLGIREERVWFQSLPDGEMAVVYWEGDDPRGALGEFLAPTQTRRLGSPGSLGNKPLAVVTAGTSEPSWLELQDKLATLSSNSIHRVVKGATHTSLEYDRSDAQATSAAIVEVVAAVRNDRPLAQENP